MSSARKRQRAGRVAAMIDHANQQKMLAKHHADVMGAMAEEIGRSYEKMRTVMQQVLTDAQAQDVLPEWWPLMEEALGSNAKVRWPTAALSPEAPSRLSGSARGGK